MLTQNEKDILGAMVDMGLLKGDDRKSTGASDEIAREKIAEFKAQQTTLIPMQIEGLTSQLTLVEAEIARLTELQTLLGE